jgi:hypothetical protein
VIVPVDCETYRERDDEKHGLAGRESKEDLPRRERGGGRGSVPGRVDLPIDQRILLGRKMTDVTQVVGESFDPFA